MIKKVQKDGVPAVILEVHPEGLKDEGIFVCAKISAGSGDRDMYPEVLTDLNLPLCIISEKEECGVKEYPYPSVLKKLFYENGISEAYRAALKEYRPSSILMLAVCGDADTSDITERFFVNECEADAFGEEDAEYEEKLISDIKASCAMSEELKRLIKYDRLAGTGLKDIIKRQYEEGKLPCNDKREGKAVLALLRQYCELAPSCNLTLKSLK